MNRFYSQRSDDPEPSRTLEAVAAELRASLERQVREIVAAAEERAAEIESDAARKAELIGREPRNSTQAGLQGELGRAWAILGGIDDLESRVSEVIAELRSEMEALIADLESRTGSEARAASETQGSISQERAQ